MEKSIFPFFRLPAELRNEIYSLVLKAETPLFVSTPRYFKVKPMLRLLSVCRQIRSEAGGIFYSDNRFTFHVDPRGTRDLYTLRHFLFLSRSTISSTAHSLVQELNISFDVCGSPHDHGWAWQIDHLRLVFSELESLARKHFLGSNGKIRFLLLLDIIGTDAKRIELDMQHIISGAKQKAGCIAAIRSEHVLEKDLTREAFAQLADALEHSGKLNY